MRPSHIFPSFTITTVSHHESHDPHSLYYLIVIQRFPSPANYRNICGKNIAKHPYGELGSVERGNCCCCIAADSAFGPISPGCGCDGEKVDDIVTVLKERMRNRGDTAQIKRTEETLLRLQEVDAKLVRRSHFNIKRNEDNVSMCCHVPVQS